MRYGGIHRSENEFGGLTCMFCLVVRPRISTVIQQCILKIRHATMLLRRLGTSGEMIEIHSVVPAGTQPQLVECSINR